MTNAQGERLLPEVQRAWDAAAQAVLARQEPQETTP